jgi:hypothetical protein
MYLVSVDTESEGKSDDLDLIVRRYYPPTGKANPYWRATAVDEQRAQMIVGATTLKLRDEMNNSR